MKETYKEVLANKYARESNYTIITPTDTLEELETLWNKFLTTMTIRQQRLCDDRSLQIYGLTNLQHYEQLKAEFEKKKPEEKPQKKIFPDESESIVSDKKTDSFTTDIDSDFEGLIIDEDASTTETGFSSGIYVIPDITGETPEEQLEDLEQHYSKYMSLSVDKRRLSDDGERMMYGLSNQERYDRIKGELLASIDTTSDSKKEFTLTPDSSEDKAAVVDEMFHDKNTFVGQHFLQALEESKKSDKHIKSRLNNTPYFTPTELIDMGVHGNDNYYSKTADNDGLTKDISVTTWFDSYKEMISQHVYEDYTAEWIDTLNRLYLDYDEIKECGTEDEILARKQSILDLGWNPEIDFTPENRIKASKRINDYVDNCVPSDVFIDMDTVVPDDLPDTVEEAVSKTTHKPVFIVLTKGKTPILSSSIQKVTNSEYSHASISFDCDLKELYSYNFRKQNLGFVLEKLSTIKNVPITVWCFFAESEVVDRMKKKVYDFKTHDTHYDFRMFPRFIAKKDIKPDDNEFNQVCSTFVDTILKAGNIDLVNGINMPSPGDIYHGIKTRSNTIFVVYDGLAGLYDGSKVKKKVNYLLNKDTTEAVTEACKDVKTARKFVREVEKLAKRYDANYFIVTDGASGIHNNGNPAVKNARDAQIRWERENGYDPDEDWSKNPINEAINDLKNGVNPYGNKTFYHLSFDENLDEKTLVPRVPEWIKGMKEKDKDFESKLEKFKTENNPDGYGYEDPKTPRICFSNSIEGALNAIINPNKRLHLAGKQIYVFVPEKPISEYKTRSNKVIKKNGDVFDANVTNEMWILEPCKVKFIGSIVVDKVTAKKRKKFTNNKEMNVMEYSYKWRWYHKISKKERFHEAVSIFNEASLPSGVSLRAANKNDEENIYKWEMESIDPSKRTKSRVIKLMQQDAKESVNHAKMIMYNGETIGMYDVVPIDGGEWTYIGEIYIVKEHRNKGIGTALLKDTIEKHDRIKLRVASSNTKAIKLYKSLGFEVVEKEDVKSYIMALDKTESLKEAVSIFNEMKKFPVEFDKDGNLIIYKCSTGNIDFDEEIDNSVTLLETYRNTNNEEGMKYELAKMWFIIAELEKRMKKRNVPVDEYNKLVRQRSVAMNIFKTNFKYMSNLDKSFNFAAYYNSTPFSDNGVKITNSTLRYGMAAMKRIVR